MSRPRILVFDSGMGGLTVARAVRTQLPNAELIYAADTAGFPYGAWAESKLIDRIVAVLRALIERVKPDVVVIACNTASTIAMIPVRRSFALPFVGTVPAIKPAATISKSGVIGVLATPGTVAREYTHSLVHTYASHCKVILHGAKKLAGIAEMKLRGHGFDLEELRAEVAPVFVDDSGRRTDVVVLGCTHYPLIVDEIRSVAPWDVSYVDPAPAIARRVEHVLQDATLVQHLSDETMDGVVLVTSAIDSGSVSAYKNHGFSVVDVVDLPV